MLHPAAPMAADWTVAVDVVGYCHGYYHRTYCGTLILDHARSARPPRRRQTSLSQEHSSGLESETAIQIG